MSPKVARAFTALLLGSAVCILAQTPQTSTAPPPPASRPQFFAGTVTELTPQQITVSRTLAGRAPDKRSFVITSKTRMNKAALKVKSRVTVRYQHLADADVALEIQLQPLARSPRSP